MGCLKNVLAGIGCLTVLVVAAVLGIRYHGRIAELYRHLRGEPAQPPVVWVAPTPAAATSAANALRALARPRGPAFVDLSAEEIAALIQRELAPGARPVFDSVAVALGPDRVAVRGSLDLTRLPPKLLGPLAAGLGPRERVTAGGTLAATAEGRVWWTVDELQIRDFPFPRAVLPSLLQSIGIPGVRGVAVPLPLRAPVGDVRVTPHGVRAYRASPR